MLNSELSKFKLRIESKPLFQKHERRFNVDCIKVAEAETANVAAALS